jgi:GNAT superfamily N-acetyltransferase
MKGRRIRPKVQHQIVKKPRMPDPGIHTLDQEIRMNLRDFSISPVHAADVGPVCELAREIWMQHYPGIITVKQIEYMLAQRYSPDAIRMQLYSGEAWWEKLLVRDELCGFVCYERANAAGEMKLDKLYVHQLVRGRGYGAALIARVETAARQQGMNTIYLQVNKYNHASIAAYLRCGFGVKRAVKADIGNGFFMDDYLMSKRVAAA